MNVLIIYDRRQMLTNTVWDHVLSFKRYMPHHVYYSHGVGELGLIGDLEEFDVVVIHYSIRVAFNSLSSQLDSALQTFTGVKVLFVQDEYEYTENVRQTIERLGIDIVFTCVPQGAIERVYPSSRFSDTLFVPNLTGYAPPEYEQQESWRPMLDRTFLIGYRGRSLAFWYGNLPQEKRYIGQRMLEECRKRALNVDIEWAEDRRIYGKGWYEFLSNCRVTLGTESGSNVFDYDGAIREAVQKLLDEEPKVSYEDVFKRYLAPHEGQITMNQISPRIFEAICLRTGLVLFEGAYSGVLEPNVHYIPLKKDFSNVDEVLSKIQDVDLLTTMTNRTYQDIITSGRFGYGQFMKTVSSVIETAYEAKRKKRPGGNAVADNRGWNARWQTVGAIRNTKRQPLSVTLIPHYLPHDPDMPRRPGYIVLNTLWPSRLWNMLPKAIRRVLKPIISIFVSGVEVRNS